MDCRSSGGTRCEDDSLENEKGIGTMNEHKGASKRGTSQTRGTAMSFGFRRRPTSGIPMPVANYSADSSLLHPRSKSAGPERNHRRDDDNINSIIRNSSSTRSTPRLAPPKKESSGIAVRINRFGYRQPPAKFTNKVGDICSSHTVSHYNQEKLQQHPQQDAFPKQSHRVVHVCNTTSASKVKLSPVHNSTSYNNANSMHVDGNRKPSGIPEPIGRYTLQTSHLPLPQYAVRMTDANSKTAKTAANQSRKVSTISKSSSSKEGSSTEDSGVGSQLGCTEEGDLRGTDVTDGSLTRRRGTGRPRNLKMVVSGKSFDVRDVRDDDNTVTEISVIPLPKTFATTTNIGLVRDRATRYQRIVNKDNRYTESTTSMSTTSSEGYDEGMDEEKVYKDRSHSEKIPSIKSDFSPPSSDDPEYGHGEAMADEYSLSSSDECQRSTQQFQTSSHSSKNGALPKTASRNVLLTIEDPAFAAAAATSTTLIDDETSPVDSLFDSLTASITQSDVKAQKKEQITEQSGNVVDDDSLGTPTNASNSLSLSEGREFFDDEIADQPGLVFDDNSRAGAETQSTMASQVVTENSHTLVESSPKAGTAGHGKNVTNSPHHGKRMSRAGSVDTLSPCESIASDDLILDYEQSDGSSYDEQHRLEQTTAVHQLEDATILSELEAQGEKVMRQWSSLLGTCQTLQQTNNSNTVNNNVSSGSANNNNQTSTEMGNEFDNTRIWQGRSMIDSSQSTTQLDGLRNRLLSSPLKTSRNVRSPSLESGDEGSIRVDRDTYQYMHQDIVSIKTMLLKLKRVLQESEEDDLARVDTLSPFDNTMKNGELTEENTSNVSTSPGSGGSSIADEMADLRRQVVFLQGQVEDRDRTIHVLQSHISKLQGPNSIDGQHYASGNKFSNNSSSNSSNAATQTEKTRPISAGSSSVQILPRDGVTGPLVSWSESWNRQQPLIAC